MDINRDATDLKTPEASLLKQLRDAWTPEIGFNLHNQNSLTSVGQTPMQAAISLLVVYGDEAKTRRPATSATSGSLPRWSLSLQKFHPRPHRPLRRRMDAERFRR